MSAEEVIDSWLFEVDSMHQNRMDEVELAIARKLMRVTGHLL